jgi:hypothetical protein
LAEKSASLSRGSAAGEKKICAELDKIAEVQFNRFSSCKLVASREVTKAFWFA